MHNLLQVVLKAAPFQQISGIRAGCLCLGAPPFFQEPSSLPRQRTKELGRGRAGAFHCLSLRCDLCYLNSKSYDPTRLHRAWERWVTHAFSVSKKCLCQNGVLQSELFQVVWTDHVLSAKIIVWVFCCCPTKCCKQQLKQHKFTYSSGDQKTNIGPIGLKSHWRPSCVPSWKL